jgi:hypothetical protein
MATKRCKPEAIFATLMRVDILAPQRKIVADAIRQIGVSEVTVWSRVILLALVLLPAQALAGAKENVAALAPSGLVLVMSAMSPLSGVKQKWRGHHRSDAIDPEQTTSLLASPWRCPASVERVLLHTLHRRW